MSDAVSPFYKAGTMWTKEDDVYLHDRFTTGMALEELCRLHGRTPAAIITRLVHQNRLVLIGTGYRRVGEQFTTITEVKQIAKELGCPPLRT